MTELFMSAKRNTSGDQTVLEKIKQEYKKNQVVVSCLKMKLILSDPKRFQVHWLCTGFERYHLCR